MFKINDVFQIRGDGNLNFELYELKVITSKKTKEKKQQWILIGCFGKIEHALKNALNKYLLNIASAEETVSLNNLLAFLHDIYNDLKNIKLLQCKGDINNE